MATAVLTVANLSKSFNIYPVFADVTFTLNAGERVALVGPNGVGKSTVLKIIAGRERATSGGVVKARGARVVYVAQEAASSFASEADLSVALDDTLYNSMLDATGPVRALQEQLRELEASMATIQGEAWDRLMEEYQEATHRFEMAGGYSLEHRIEEVVQGLGFKPEQYAQSLNTMSGGQRTRAALARALLADPDILLLDEPTNHLDIEAIEWLESFLTQWRGTLLTVAHDRRFLNKVTQRTLDMEFTRPVMRVTTNGRTPRELGMQEAFSRLQDYPAPYDKYLELKAERYELLTAQYEAEQEMIKRTEYFIRRYMDSQKTKQAVGRLKRLRRMERLERPTEKTELRVSLRAHIRSGRSVFEAEDLVIGYPAADDGRRTADDDAEGSNNPKSKIQNPKSNEPKRLAYCPDLEIERGERVALLGPNGVGKTTLLKTIMGQLAPLSGHLELGHNVKFGYYAQAHEGLNGENSVLEEIRSIRSMTEQEARDLLAKMLFSGDNIYKQVSDLSGGERSRVALTKLTLTDANFLILDEPTNHLDLDSQEVLTDVLSNYDGTILFVSHDRAFIDDLATQTWTFEGDRLATWDGNYTDYVAEKARRQQVLEVAQPVKISVAVQKPDPREESKSAQRQDRAAQRDRTKLLKRREAAEHRISDLEARLNAVSDALTAATEKRDLDAIVKLGTEYTQLESDLDQAYSDWQQVEEEVGAAT
ncbi:MAG TPA: ABC-F family ATP-binding cassette domain-containing protein [Chloroflexia bacterium]|nr:ABC-F family ATP-binding cassette domain-containing protein [Chloroflexia bacterium]